MNPLPYFASSRTSPLDWLRLSQLGVAYAGLSIATWCMIVLATHGIGLLGFMLLPIAEGPLHSGLFSFLALMGLGAGIGVRFIQPEVYARVIHVFLFSVFSSIPVLLVAMHVYRLYLLYDSRDELNIPLLMWWAIGLVCFLAAGRRRPFTTFLGSLSAILICMLTWCLVFSSAHYDQSAFLVSSIPFFGSLALGTGSIILDIAKLYRHIFRRPVPS